MNGHRHELRGHVAPGHHLDPLTAIAELPRFGRSLAAYARDQDPWALDTARLPLPLRELRRRVRDFAERELRPRVERLELAEDRSADEIRPELLELLATAGREGLLTNLLPRPFGTLPTRQARFPIPWRLAIQAEELARVCGGQALMLLAHHQGVGPVLLSGDFRAMRCLLIPAFRKSEQGEPHLFAFAVTEPEAGSDMQLGWGAARCRPEVVASRASGGWRLHGRKRYITGGDIAQSINVCATLEGEPTESLTCFLVRRDMPGFSVARTERKMGLHASGTAEICLDGVFVPDDHVIGGLRRGWGLTRALLNASRLPVAGMAVGLATGAAEAAIDFVTRTRLGGRPLIDFQEIQLAVAQMVGELRMIRSLVSALGQHGWRPYQGDACIGKFQATDRAQRICELAMELMSNHGGCYPNRAEPFYRDLRPTRIFESTNEINRLAVIEDLQPHLLEQVNHAHRWRL